MSRSGTTRRSARLLVRCDSSAWATQLRLLAPRLVARLNEELGQGTVRMIKVRGPEAPRKGYGPLRAPGSTGPGGHVRVTVALRALRWRCACVSAGRRVDSRQT